MVKDSTAKQPSHQPFIPIAIVGVGALFAGAKNASDYWRNIIEKRDLISDIPPSHWLISDYYEPNQKTSHQTDKIYSKRGSFIEDIDFDSVEYGTPPSTLSAIDTSQLLALIVAKQVLNDLSGYDIGKLNLEKTSVILGVSVLEAVQYLCARTQRPVWEKALRKAGLSEALIDKACNNIADSYPKWQEDSFPGLLSNVVSGRIANRFNLGGTNCTTDAACASSLAAILAAVNELQTGTADMVITGGVDSLNDILMYKCFSIVGALSPSSHCRPFSEAADGTLLGEGLALFALKRLEEAEKNHDKIYGVIRGIGTSSDGRSKSIYAPVSEGQSKAVLRAYERAGYDISTVGLIEAHGTGTIAGDYAEYHGLLKAFQSSKHKTKPASCALGSVKSQIGHTKSAAGAAGLLKALMAIRHKTYPATLHVDKVNSRFDQHNSPLYINTETRPWIQNPSTPRRAGVSCFGFGGSNFHLTLEEYQRPENLAPKIRTLETECVIVSGNSVEEVQSAITSLLSDYSEKNFSQIAYQSQVNFQQHPEHQYRLVMIAKNKTDLKEKLNHSLIAQNRFPEDVYYGVVTEKQKKEKIAFCFSGQSSQYTNMAKDLLLHFDCAMKVWEELAPEKISSIVYPVPVFSKAEKIQQEAVLMQTEHVQPALALVELTQLALLDTLNIQSDACVGNSFGELIALYDAKAVDAKTVVDMSIKRGELMQQAQSTDPGAMLAVKVDEKTLKEKIGTLPKDAYVSNINSLNQICLSGTQDAISECEKHLEANQISFIRLPVSGAFHTPLMESARKSFSAYLKTLKFHAPIKPVYANLTANTYNKNDITQHLSDQLTHPVQFHSSIQKLYHEENIRIFIQIGPGRAVSQLVKDSLHPEEVQHAKFISLDNQQASAVTAFWRAIAILICSGKNPELLNLWKDYPVEAQHPVLKSNKFKLKINGTNYQKPYPVFCSDSSDSSVSTKTSFTSPHSHPLETTKMSTTSETTTTHSLTQSTLLHELQRQLVEVHNNHQNALLQSHMAFLNTFSQLIQPTNGINSHSSTQALLHAPVQTLTRPLPTPALHTAPMPTQALAPAPTPIITPAVMPQFTAQTAPSAATQTIPTIATTTTPTIGTGIVTENKTHNTQDIVMETIVEKTGYPLEMLNPEMDIEADLGIDSIKRVEILSLVREKTPGLPEMPADELSALKTLQDIIQYIEKHQNKSSAPAQQTQEKKKSLSDVF